MKNYTKPFFVLLLLTVVLHFSYGQSGNYKVTYRHCVEMDTTNVLRDTLGREAILIGNTDASSYCFGKLPKNLTVPSQSDLTTIEKILAEKKSGTNVYQIGSGKRFDSIGNILYYDKVTNYISVRDKTLDDYVLTKETNPKIDWRISDETKMIKNYVCTKATCHFRGRNYTAWFTKDIPISEGPWKFKGLPGLILDIEDDKFQVKIYATDIEFPTTESVAKFVELGIPLTLQQYVGYRNEEGQKQMRKMEAALQGQEFSDRVPLQTKVKTKIGMYGIEKSLD